MADNRETAVAERDQVISRLTNELMTLHGRIHRALDETRREIDAPDTFTLSHHPRHAWADGYTAACEAIRKVLADGD